MANKHHPHADTHASSGGMDISEHMRTWLAFWAATKWSCVGLALLGLLLLIFRTNDGV
jgi:Bacterial aa3 type cytochrome c oxidase subunit IV